MPSIAQIIKDREANGEKVRDFLSQSEVDALLKGVTPETEDPHISEDDWAAAMAVQADEECQASRQYSYRADWETIGMSVSDWRKIVELLKTQPIGEFYDIYTTIISNLPRK